MSKNSQVVPTYPPMFPKLAPVSGFPGDEEIPAGTHGDGAGRDLCTCTKRPCTRTCQRCADCAASYQRWHYANRRKKGAASKLTTRWVECPCGKKRRAGGTDRFGYAYCRECKKAQFISACVPVYDGDAPIPEQVPDMPCAVCGAVEHDPILYRRGRSGAPFQRMVKALRRDGIHICWICGGDIDMTLPVNDKWSWTLDHVLSLAEYPCLGLDSSNHREAHRTCNSSKGKRTHVPHTHGGTTHNTRDW